MSAIQRILSLVALLLLMVSVSALPAQGLAQDDDRATIIISATGYDPSSLPIDIGTPITWKNSSGEDLELVAVDEDWFKFVTIPNNTEYGGAAPKTPGTYKYYTRRPGTTTVNENQGEVIAVDNSTATPSPTGTLTATATPTATATTTASPTATTSVTASVTGTTTTTVTATATPDGSATASPTVTETPTWTPTPTETPFVFPTATPYPTPSFPTTGAEDSLPPGRAVGLGLLLMLSALAVGILYRRMRPDVGYSDSDYEWRN